MVDHELDQVQELEKVANLKHCEVGSEDVDHGTEGDVGEGDVGDLAEGGAIVEELEATKPESMTTIARTHENLPRMEHSIRL